MTVNVVFWVATATVTLAWSVVGVRLAMADCGDPRPNRPVPLLVLASLLLAAAGIAHGVPHLPPGIS